MANLPPLDGVRAQTDEGKSFIRFWEQLCVLEARTTQLADAIDVVDPVTAQLASSARAIRQVRARARRLGSVALAPLDTTGSGGGGKAPPPGGGGPGPAPPNVVKNPGNKLDVILRVHNRNTSLVSQSCVQQGGNNAFLDAVVAELRLESNRWGYLCPRGNCGDQRGDAVGYYAGLEQTPPNPNFIFYTFDFIGSHCPGPGDDPATPQWSDTTQNIQNSPSNPINSWKFPR